MNTWFAEDQTRHLRLSMRISAHIAHAQPAARAGGTEPAFIDLDGAAELVLEAVLVVADPRTKTRK